MGGLELVRFPSSFSVVLNPWLRNELEGGAWVTVVCILLATATSKAAYVGLAVLECMKYPPLKEVM